MVNNYGIICFIALFSVAIRPFFPGHRPLCRTSGNVREDFSNVSGV